MLTVIASPERHLVLERSNQLQLKWQAAYPDGEVIALDGTELSFATLQPHLQNIGLFNSARLIVVDGLLAHWKTVERVKFAQVLTALPPDLSAILLEEKLDQRDKFIAKLTAVAQLEQPSPLNAAQAVSWLIEQAQQAQGSIEKSAAVALVQLCGPNLMLLKAEITKLLAYALDRPILTAHVYKLCTKLPEDQTFDFIDALLSGQLARAYGYLQDSLAAGAHAAKLLSTLANQAEKVTWLALADQYHVFDKEAVKEILGRQAWKLNSFRQLARRQPAAKWVAWWQQLARIERDIKQGRVTDDAALELLILNIYPQSGVIDEAG